MTFIPETYVRGERQSARLRARVGQEASPVINNNKEWGKTPPIIDEDAAIVNPRSTSHVSTDKRNDIINTVRDANFPDPGKEKLTESEDSNRKDVLVSDEPSSYRPTQVERGSESPSLEAVEIEVISLPMVEDA